MMKFNYPAICFSISYLIVFFLVPKIIRLSDKYQLYDLNDTYRKSHNASISRLGGVAIFLGVIVPMILIRQVEYSALPFVSSSLVILMVGLKDDLLGGAGPLEKLSLQVFAVFLSLVFIEIEKSNVALIFRHTELIFKIVVGLLIVITINAFNFIDGVNGLSGSIGFIGNFCIGIIYCVDDHSIFTLFPFFISGSILGFLTFNLLKGKIFMGDTGSMLIGLSTGMNCFLFVNDQSRPFGFDVESKLSIVVALLSVPVFDMIRVLLIRKINKKPLTAGDLNHVHHRLRKLGINDLSIVMLLLVFTGFNLSVACLIKDAGALVCVLVLGIACLLANSMITYCIGKNRSKDFKITDMFFKQTYRLHK